MSLFSSIFKKESESPGKFQVLDVLEFKKAVINKDVQLVDVRTAQEYRKGHLGKARNIDYYKAAKFKEEFEKLDKSKPVYIYCRSGHRSKKAAYRLIDMGFSSIIDLKGGIKNWR